MLTFKQFVTELAREDVTVSPAEMRDLVVRFGKKALLMGQLQEDGSTLVPVDCIVEAARSLGNKVLGQAVDSINDDQMVSMLQSGEVLVQRVVEARERKLRELIRTFQAEQDAAHAHRQWKQIEKEVFGVDYND